MRLMLFNVTTPPKHGRVVDLDASIGEHALEISVADRELQVPAHRPHDDLRRELPTLEQVLGPLLHR